MDATRHTRIDAWDAALSEQERWALYASTRARGWSDAARYAQDQYGVGVVSRSGWYRWCARMRRLEHAHKVEEAVTAVAETRALAQGARIDDRILVESLKTAAAEYVARTGSADEALKFIRMAVALGDQAARREELKLKAAAQERESAAERDNRSLRARCSELEEALREAGKTSKADPKAVADEVDRLLGRRHDNG